MKALRYVVASVCLATSLTAMAVDYDYERARRVWEDRQRLLNQADSELSREQSALRPLQQRYEDAADRVDALTVSLRNLRDEQRDTEIELTNNRSSLDRLRVQRDNLNRNLADAEADQRNAQQRRRDLAADIDTLAQDLRDLDARIADIAAADPDDPRLPELRERRDRRAENLQRKRDNLAQIDRQLSDLDREIRQVRNDLDATNRNITQTEQRITNFERRLSDLRFEISDTETNLERARDTMADARSARDRQQSVVDRAQGARDVAFREERSAHSYYQEVLANYQRAYDAAVARGRSDGNSHGDREASERGTPAGRSDGDRVGNDSGRAAGLADSRAVAEARGYNHGLANGQSDSSLGDAYRRGIADGNALATSKARAEDFPRSYNTRMNELLAVPPSAEATHDITDELPQIPGATGPLVSPQPKPIGNVAAPAYGDRSEPAINVPSPGTPSVSVPGTDRRHYSPNCSSEPLPVFNQACADSYASAYTGNYDAAYRGHYRRAYSTAFGTAADAAYRSARQTQHPDLYSAQAQVGARDKGILNGFAQALPGAQAQAVRDGRAAVETLRGQGYLPLLRSVSLDQAVEDGNFSPGEGIKVKVVLDNYGLKNAAHEKLRIRVTSLANANFSVVIRNLPAISADTRVNLEGIMRGTAGVTAGQTLRLKAILEEVQADGTATTLDEADFEAGIRLPLELTAVDFDGVLTIGQAAEARLTFTNNTNGAIEGMNLPLAITGDGLTTTATSVDVETLSGGDTARVMVPVTANEFASTSIPVMFNLTAGSIAGSSEVTITKPVGVPVTRVGKLDLCMPTCGQIVQLPLRVRAGTTLSLRTQFKFTGTRAATFEFGKLGQSDNRITAANNSTLRVGPGQWGPGSSPYDATFGYNIPTTLRGQTHWVTLYVKAGTTRIQTVKVPFVVE
jgi:septal ring factor EnvC (AmiA/AmiB activator)